MDGKQFRITLADGECVEHRADYFRIEQGCLCFRNAAHSASNGYAETVLVLAPAAWLEVQLVREPTP